MGIGVSVFLLAIGAILAFAVDLEASGIDINAVGVILMIVGAIGLLASFMFWNSWGGVGTRRVTYYDDGYDDRMPRRRVREERIVRDDAI